MKNKYIVDLTEVELSDFELVGGKNASLGEMIQNLPKLGVNIPGGFAKHIDGFSIGSNDLTQLTLGLDRDSSLVAHIYDERNPAVKRSISNLIKVAKKTNTKVGICGQGPSDYPDFAQFLVEEGIDTISVTPDSMLKTIKAIAKIENKK
jgi:pyruvate,water dikinase